MKRSACRAAVWLAIALVAGCGGPRVGVAPTDPRYEFDRGRHEFERKHWVDAQTHLKKFLDQAPGHAVADSAQLLVGLALLQSKSYAEAAVEFSIFGREYPRSPLRDEAAYDECYSYFKQMRSAQLDPTFANRAQTCFNELLLRYPDTRFKAEAEARLAEIRDLLAEKEYRLGVLFARMQRPDAARLYLQGLLQNYPQSRWAAPAELWLGRSEEQRGDFGAAATRYRSVVENFPNDPASREAREQLDKLLKDHPDLKSGDAATQTP
jgi:outer membrane protein assembly factor BamD